MGECADSLLVKYFKGVYSTEMILSDKLDVRESEIPFINHSNYFLSRPMPTLT